MLSAVLCTPVLFASRASAEDFAFIATKCESTSASLSDSSAPIMTVASTDQAPRQCTNNSGEITCESRQKDTGDLRKESYVAIIDDGSTLTFVNRDWSDYVIIDTVARTAVTILREVPESSQRAGARVCVGSFEPAEVAAP